MNRAARCVATLLAIAATGCGSLSSGIGPPPAEIVLLFSLDTLRADALASSPVLARLSEQGRTFNEVWSSSNWTLPAHVSLMSSRPFAEHQIPPPAVAPPFVQHGMDGNTVTLAAILRDAGYFTAASTEGGYVDPAFGIDAGFEHYVVVPHRSAASARQQAHVDAVRDALRRARGRPLFLFVHTYLAHDYFRNDGDYQADLPPETAALQARGSLLEQVRGGAPRRDGIPEEYLRALYARGVFLAGELVEGVLNATENFAPGRIRLVVVTSDHGESFGEPVLDGNRIVWHHGTALARTQLLVPLVVWSADDSVPPSAVPTPVSIIDVAPSLLRWLELDVPPTFRGRDDLFAPALPGRRADVAIAARQFARSSESSRFAIDDALTDGELLYRRTDRVDGLTTLQECRDLAGDIVPLPDCVGLATVLSTTLAQRADGVVRVTGTRTVHLEAMTNGEVMAVTTATGSSVPVWTSAASRSISWTPAGANDSLLMFPSGESLRLRVEVAGDFSSPLTLNLPAWSHPPERVRFDEAGIEISAHARSWSTNRAAVAATALKERLRALGYLQ